MEDILSYVDSVAPANRAAKASIDIALHDLLGKIMGQPWYKIWGLNLDNIHPTSYTISNGTPEEVQEKIKESERFRVFMAPTISSTAGCSAWATMCAGLLLWIIWLTGAMKASYTPAMRTP